MEYKDLTAFVLMLVMIGLLVGVGVLVLDKFGTSGGVSIPTAIINETHQVAANVFTTTFIDQGISGVSLGGTNLTGNITCGTTSSVTCNYTSLTGIVTTNASMGQPDVSVQYSYLANSSTTDATHAARDAIATIPEEWMSLIVTIGVLAIILGLVLMSFSMATGKNR